MNELPETTSEIYREVEQTLGHVPEFFREIPPEALPGFWSQFRDFQMTDTALPAKAKELIGLAVASTVPCAYCVTFHREAARLHGASDREMREAIAMASLTRQGSTVLNGLQQDMGRFREEVEEIARHLRSQPPSEPPTSPFP